VPQVHDFFQHLVHNLATMWTNVIDSFHHTARNTASSFTVSGLGTRRTGEIAPAVTSMAFALK
jgi:hypothetical protein